MTCNRVTSQKRGLIHQWRQAGIGNNEIARRLSRNPSSISRGIKRNPSRRGYRPKQAQAQALAEERAKRPGPRRFTEAVRKYAEGKLRQGWTPDIICGRARLKGRAHVCKETVYKHIYADAANGGDLWTHLPRAKRRRKRRPPRSQPGTALFITVVPPAETILIVR